MISEFCAYQIEKIRNGLQSCGSKLGRGKSGWPQQLRGSAAIFGEKIPVYSELLRTLSGVRCADGGNAACVAVSTTYWALVAASYSAKIKLDKLQLLSGIAQLRIRYSRSQVDFPSQHCIGGTRIIWL
jgi:hypothetical protein